MASLVSLPSDLSTPSLSAVVTLGPPYVVSEATIGEASFAPPTLQK